MGRKLNSIFILVLAMILFCAGSVRSESFIKTRIRKVKAPLIKDERRMKQVLRTLEVPEDIGVIKEVHVPENPTGQLVFNIQDLHCNYEAQRNIAKILDYLTDRYGLKVICVEGGSGKIDTTFYRELPDDTIKEQVADYFLREARINGTEYFAINTVKDIALYGAEDQEHYDKNLQAFLDALPHRESILRKIDILENNLNILKNRIYNKKLLELDERVVAYENGELGFEDYVQFLANEYPEKNLKREFSQLWQLVESLEIKKGLDLKEAEKQRQELIDVLSKKLPRQDMEELLKATVEFKAKSLDVLSFHNALAKLYDGLKGKSRVLCRQWPQLGRYIEYLNKHETLDKFELFNELDRMVALIKNENYTSFTQKNLDQSLGLIRLARNLFSTKLLNRDLEKVKKRRDDFNLLRLVRFIEQEARRLELDLPIPEELEELTDNLPKIEAFYLYANKRDHILSDNTLASMDQEGDTISILVTGGFHSGGITEYFKEKRISFVVICPVIQQLDQDDQKYIDALRGKKTPFELMMESETDTLPDIYFNQNR